MNAKVRASLSKLLGNEQIYAIVRMDPNDSGPNRQPLEVLAATEYYDDAVAVAGAVMKASKVAEEVDILMWIEPKQYWRFVSWMYEYAPGKWVETKQETRTVLK